MADWPGTKTNDNPYWFRGIKGGDVSTLLSMINSQEGRVVLRGIAATTYDVAVNSSLIFVRVSGDTVITFNLNSYATVGVFSLQGMTLNGTFVSGMWAGIGPGGLLYTWAAVFEPKEPAGDSVWHIGVNKYGNTGLDDFWQASFTVGREDIDPRFDDYQSFVSISVGGSGSRYVWVGFRRVTMDTPQFSSPSFNTWLRKYGIDGGFMEEYSSRFLGDGRFTASMWMPLRGAANEMLIVETEFSGGTDSYIYDEDIDEVELAACDPINAQLGPFDPEGGGLYLLNSNQDYAVVGDDIKTHNSFVEGLGVCGTMANMGGQTSGIASRDTTSDKRLYITRGTDNEVTVYNYATGELIFVIELFRYEDYPLTSWFRFPTMFWSDRDSVGTFPGQDVFDGMLDGRPLDTSLALWATILQGRDALIELIPHFRNSSTEESWEFSQIYQKAMADGVAAGRNYGDSVGVTWFHPHFTDEQGNPALNASHVAMRAIDFGEIFEIATLLGNSEPMIIQQ